MKKRGISAVVATILIILIVVVGVGIVWKVILPLFAEIEYLSYSDVQLNVVFQGHTVYDENQHFAFVQVERGSDEVNMTGIEIGFNFDGTTKTYQSKNVPSPRGTYTYKFNFTNDSDMGIQEGVTPDKVTVAPIFTVNNKVRLGKILDEKPMPVGRVHLSAEAWAAANEDAATPIVVTTGSGGGEEPGEPVEPEEPEIVLVMYYYDSDGDGYANDSVSQDFEEGKNSSGYILMVGDCDDSSANINPGVPELFGNSIDENCDGEICDAGWLEYDGYCLEIIDGAVTILEESIFADNCSRCKSMSYFHDGSWNTYGYLQAGGVQTGYIYENYSWVPEFNNPINMSSRFCIPTGRTNRDNYFVKYSCWDYGLDEWSQFFQWMGRTYPSGGCSSSRLKEVNNSIPLGCVSDNKDLQIRTYMETSWVSSSGYWGDVRQYENNLIVEM